MYCVYLMTYNRETRDAFNANLTARQSQTFQACVGPTMNRLHIRTVVPFGTVSDLVLCARTAPARDYKAATHVSNICKRCLHEMFIRLGHHNLTAELIGVSDIEI